jgi:hypothetical protein
VKSNPEIAIPGPCLTIPWPNKLLIRNSEAVNNAHFMDQNYRVGFL